MNIKNSIKAIGCMVLLLSTAFVIGMDAPAAVKVRLGHWKNATNKNVLINLEVNENELFSQENLAKLPAGPVGSEKNINKAIPLTINWLKWGVYSARLIIKDPTNSANALELLIIYHSVNPTFLSAVLRNRAGKQIDEHMLGSANPNTPLDLIIQGTLRGDDLGQSKIELVPVQR